MSASINNRRTRSQGSLQQDSATIHDNLPWCTPRLTSKRQRNINHQPLTESIRTTNRYSHLTEDEPDPDQDRYDIQIAPIEQDGPAQADTEFYTPNSTLNAIVTLAARRRPSNPIRLSFDDQEDAAVTPPASPAHTHHAQRQDDPNPQPPADPLPEENAHAELLQKLIIRPFGEAP